jgi:hypothetical protein
MNTVEKNIEITNIIQTDFSAVVDVAREVYSKILGDWNYNLGIGDRLRRFPGI